MTAIIRRTNDGRRYCKRCGGLILNNRYTFNVDGPIHLACRDTRTSDPEPGSCGMIDVT